MSVNPTGPLQPGEGQTVIPPSNPPAEKTGVRVLSAGLTLDLNAKHLVNAMSQDLLTHHRASILTGQRPDGGGAQAALGLKAASQPGRLTQHRGAKTGHLADELHRTEITGDSAHASTRIEPPGDRFVYVRKEAKHGRQLITAEGAAAEVAQGTARRMVAEMAQGQGFAEDVSDVKARET
jgi:hypothetical protein